MNNKLDNSNKRTTLLFLIILLRHFDYHLDWSKRIRKKYKYYESILSKFVKKLQNGYNENEVKEI